MPHVVIGQRIKRARSAREDSSLYIIGMPFPRSQARKHQIPGAASSAKSGFVEGSVWVSPFGPLQESPQRVPTVFWSVFGVFWEVLCTSKTCDSVQYILKKSAFYACLLPGHISMSTLKRFGLSGGVWGGCFGRFWVLFVGW